MATSTTSQLHVSEGRTAAWLKAAVLLSLGVFALFLLFYNLTDYPKTWFDEGSHLHVPKAFVLFGVYADYSSEGFRHYGPTIGVGPTVMLPIAAAFQAFGIGMLQARLVMVLYLAVAVLLFFLLARHLLGTRAAWIAVALLVTSPAIDMVEFGRQVLGEVPGLAFMLAGFLLWFLRWRQAHWWEITLVGLLFGLSVVTKYQYLLVLGATLLLAWGLNLVFFKRPQRLFLVPGIVTGVVFGAWQLFTLVYLGPATIGENLASLREFTAGAAAVFSTDLMLRSLGELFSQKAFLWMLFPALLYSGWWLVRRRPACRQPGNRPAPSAYHPLRAGDRQSCLVCCGVGQLVTLRLCRAGLLDAVRVADVCRVDRRIPLLNPVADDAVRPVDPRRRWSGDVAPTGGHDRCVRCATGSAHCDGAGGRLGADGACHG